MSFEECVFAFKVDDIDMFISTMCNCTEKYHEAIALTIPLWTHKGETHLTCSQWRDGEHWFQIESRIIDVLLFMGRPTRYRK